MSVVKVRRDGQITLPTQIRKALGIRAGDLVEVEPVAENVILIKLKKIANKRPEKIAKEVTKELVNLNLKDPLKEVSEEEIEAMVDEVKPKVFERYYGKI